MEFTKMIELDMNAENNCVLISAKQGDMIIRRIAVKFKKDGINFNPVYSHVWFRMKKPDGKYVIQTDEDTEAPITSSEGTFYIPMKLQALAVEGVAECDLVLLDEVRNILSSSNFKMNIVPMPDILHQVVSGDDFQRLLDAIEAADEALEQALAVVTNLQFKVEDELVKYSTDGGLTWRILSPVSDIVHSITNEQIDALFAESENEGGNSNG